MKWCNILLFGLFLGNIVQVSCVTAASFRNLSPPETALHCTSNYLSEFSINQCNIKWSIRFGCDSIWYKTVINMCKLYISTDLVWLLTSNPVISLARFDPREML
jgi:hypothetical protein